MDISIIKYQITIPNDKTIFFDMSHSKNNDIYNLTFTNTTEWNHDIIFFGGRNIFTSSKISNFKSGNVFEVMFE